MLSYYLFLFYLFLYFLFLTTYLCVCVCVYSPKAYKSCFIHVFLLFICFLFLNYSNFLFVFLTFLIYFTHKYVFCKYLVRKFLFFFYFFPLIYCLLSLLSHLFITSSIIIKLCPQCDIYVSKGNVPNFLFSLENYVNKMYNNNSG